MSPPERLALDSRYTIEATVFFRKYPFLTRSIDRSMPPTPDLEQLLSNPSTSDAEIAAALLADYHARLFRLACSFLQEADEAEDAPSSRLWSRPCTTWRATSLARISERGCSRSP